MAQPLKLAIIGGGASAFYAASRVLSKLPEALKETQVHIYDRLWTPHGLVRYGVAPDHPEVKVSVHFPHYFVNLTFGELIRCAAFQNCTNKFDATALDPRFRFFGNVQIVPSDPLSQQAASPGTERRLSLPQPLNLSLSSLARHYTHLLFAYGSSTPLLPTLAGDSPLQPISALDFVHWYTSHPYPTTKIPLERLIKAKHITVIGHGNVALDVARMILSSPTRLAPYDVPQSVLDVLEQLQVQHVSVVGRRAPPQVSFTAKEVREMMTLEGVGMHPIDPNLFNLGETQTVPTDLVIASVGYRSPVIHPAWHDKRLGRVRHVDGQVVREDGTAVRGVYASGWAANGARGVLASTMWNAYSVAEKILGDATASAVSDSRSETRVTLDNGVVLKGEPGLPSPVVEAGKLVISYPDWKRVDAEEIRRGGELGKERERMSWEEVVEFLDID
ncbi:NADPH-adrenodoxin reductase [Ceratobasidium sp. 423]|nr:NADPH-adrenodoxin reductase [Ceratobasidium sp. 423]